MNRWARLAILFVALSSACVESPTEPMSLELLTFLPAEFPTASGEIDVVVNTLTGEHPTAPIVLFAERRVPFAHVTGGYTELRLRVPARKRDGEQLIVEAFICLPDGSVWTAGISGSLAELRDIAANRVGPVFTKRDFSCLPLPG